MKILVTGGAGFVGSHLVDACVARGDEVIVIDHHKKEKKRFPNQRAKIYKIGITDPSIKTIIAQERPDAVCHLAAQISVTRSVADPIHDADVNIVSSLPLLEYASELGVKKFVFASSGGAIYGDHGVLPTPELQDAKPISPYGVAKQMFEYYLQSFYQTRGMPYVALRFSNIFGPRQMMHDEGEGSVMAIFLSRLLTGDPVTIFGDGSATRDFVFVKDAVRAFLHALDSDHVGVVNISTGREVSVQELWDALQEIHGAEHRVLYAPDRPGEITRSVLARDLAREKLGWEPQTSFEEGLRETYNWFMDEFGS